MLLLRHVVITSKQLNQTGPFLLWLSRPGKVYGWSKLGKNLFSISEKFYQILLNLPSLKKYVSMLIIKKLSNYRILLYMQAMTHENSPSQNSKFEFTLM